MAARYEQRVLRRRGVGLSGRGVPFLREAIEAHDRYLLPPRGGTYGCADAPATNWRAGIQTVSQREAAWKLSRVSSWLPYSLCWAATSPCFGMCVGGGVIPASRTKAPSSTWR